MLAKKFQTEMIDRGVRRLDDEAFVYHLALLLRPEGHPTIRLTDEDRGLEMPGKPDGGSNG